MLALAGGGLVVGAEDAAEVLEAAREGPSRDQGVARG